MTIADTRVIEPKQTRPTGTMDVRVRLATITVRVLNRTKITPLHSRTLELAENDQDLQILKAAETRYAGLNWRETFKPLK